MEANLRDRRLASLGVTAWAAAPGLLVGDIGRSGVFAALVGTLALLPPPNGGG
ncbi:MAG TPA: hypothetical protein VIK99_02585 [Thermaerobacter sp.]